MLSPLQLYNEVVITIQKHHISKTFCNFSAASNRALSRIHFYLQQTISAENRQNRMKLIMFCCGFQFLLQIRFCRLKPLEIIVAILNIFSVYYISTVLILFVFWGILVKTLSVENFLMNCALPFCSMILLVILQLLYESY